MDQQPFQEPVEKIKIRCESCKGSGLKPYATVPLGIGVICPHCQGEGSKILEITRFSRKRHVDGVTKVVLTTNPFAAVDKTVDFTGAVSYQEFLEGKMPTT